MIYLKCLTCRTLLGNKEIPYYEGLEKICNNSKLSQEEKDREKKKLLDDLHIINYCCRMRVITMIRLDKLIK